MHATVLSARINRIQSELAECGGGNPVPLSRNGIHRIWGRDVGPGS